MAELAGEVERIAVIEPQALPGLVNDLLDELGLLHVLLFDRGLTSLSPAGPEGPGG
jgi:hypothetical protein